MINLTLKDLLGACRYVFNAIITVAFCCDVDILHVCPGVHFRYMLRSRPHPLRWRMIWKQHFRSEHEMFSVLTGPQTITDDFEFVFEESTGREIKWFIVTPAFSLSPVFKICFPFTPKGKSKRFQRRLRKAAFSWHSVVWTPGLSVGIKLCFQISPRQCGRCLKE